MAGFTREFAMFTAQPELANRNFAAASVPKKWGSLLQSFFPSLPSFPLPDTCYAGYLCEANTWLCPFGVHIT